MELTGVWYLSQIHMDFYEDAKKKHILGFKINLSPT